MMIGWWWLGRGLYYSIYGRSSMLGIRFLSNQDWNDICSFEHCAHGRNMRSSTKESRISGCLPMVALLVGIIVGRKKIHPKIWTTLTSKGSLSPFSKNRTFWFTCRCGTCGTRIAITFLTNFDNIVQDFTKGQGSVSVSTLTNGKPALSELGMAPNMRRTSPNGGWFFWENDEKVMMYIPSYFPNYSIL